ncbi:ABC transporter ATP-binding protein [Agromyces aureus]|uniref:Spermidine/putrescine import ATP-binding protein PotA n=1 Tax=Agromyces aureus TaxID=453304 RepID=A0A191WCG6_9MICO|nr:ABC transporter ATP-binding protein [Agromyces aureus]ANJ25874.1 spermidine/putrescine ABC transporter ATP-binding protein [Agromyces aureus]
MTTATTIEAGGGAAPGAGTPHGEAPGTVVIDSVTKHYGDATAVDRLSLTIQPGEFISLLGPSGCGKTTTLRMIAGFEHPDAGDIRVSGRSVLGVPPYRRDVNTVFQAYALFPHMSVAENVAYGLQQKRTPKSEIRQRVVDALDLAQMRGFADRKPTQLSGGQQQRVALARALVNRPSVLLLDEPLGALDRQLREEMQLELKLLQSRLGITFVFVTHDQGEALSMSDRIAIMRSGRIEQLADADTVYARPASAYVAAFVGQQNFFRGTVVEGGAAVDSVHALVRGGAAELAVGEQGQAAVRPEFVEIAADAPDAAASGTSNTARGRLIGVSHLGETMQYLVQLGDDQSLIARRPSPEAPQLAVGDAVVCSWRAESVLLFPSDDAASAGGYVAPPTA